MSSPTTERPVLYSYFRSSCSWRVRIALNLKKIDYECRPINLLKSEQRSEEYLKIQPSGFVPAYIDNTTGKTLSQSISILEYLDDIYPEHSLLPKDPLDRATVRALVQTIAMDIQPIANLRILNYVGEDKKAEWAAHFLAEGFKVLEAMLAKTAGTYAFGDSITMADLCIVPQVYNGVRFGVDMSAFPIISRINRSLGELPEFEAAHPSRQIDCPADLK
ncbi:glutathione S-transferase [Gamsiella multidivaricata]|uniref:glutathione S-transferase n=1 Tax=Gamsiella multidivaricata TaxID=101098 RepID=UPI00221F6D7B|nr:glutathione S-transferase [Gamsiella multidivaricata]KAG0353387.1 Glutathione S-transferase zeta-1 [Gamsiella multidivaricata]KAI7819231.1 glutathione S-transferase [Gamsiella multidivaricata]